MKRCPKCSQTYVDDSLQYCLTDGALLVTDTGISDSHATLVYEQPKKTKSSRRIILFVAAALFFVISGLSAAVLLYVFVYKNNSTEIVANQNADTPNKQPTPIPQPSPVLPATPEENTEGNPTESPSPEASASPSPEPGASPSPNPNIKESNSKVDSQFFTFELKQCKLSGSSVACDFIVTNNDSDRELVIRKNSTIFDQENNRYEARRIRLANNEDTFGVKAYMVSGVPTKASIIFEGVASTANKLSLMYISLRTNTGEFDIEYRNVRLIR